MVRSFVPQGRNSNIKANTNNPPQGIDTGVTPPTTDFWVDNLGVQFVDNTGEEFVFTT